jgi:hypothetical protein
MRIQVSKLGTLVSIADFLGAKPNMTGAIAIESVFIFAFFA